MHTPETIALVRTHCCICRQPLTDAQSVEHGMGPTCRKRFRLPKTLTGANRMRANDLITLMAQSTEATPEQVASAVLELHALGATALADRLAANAGAAKVEITESAVRVDVGGYDQNWVAIRRKWGGAFIRSNQGTFDEWRAEHQDRAAGALRERFGANTLIRLTVRTGDQETSGLTTAGALFGASVDSSNPPAPPAPPPVKIALARFRGNVILVRTPYAPAFVDWLKAEVPRGLRDWNKPIWSVRRQGPSFWATLNEQIKAIWPNAQVEVFDMAAPDLTAETRELMAEQAGAALNA